MNDDVAAPEAPGEFRLAAHEVERRPSPRRVGRRKVARRSRQVIRLKIAVEAVGNEARRFKRLADPAGREALDVIAVDLDPPDADLVEEGDFVSHVPGLEVQRNDGAEGQVGHGQVAPRRLRM
ncbi:MAG: hypothetical protein NTU94_14800 [Planctomycetota bacterium]|nr:hypothetical protein [Planctomycetota bacterium]